MMYKRVLILCIDSLSRAYQQPFERYFNVSYRQYQSTNTWTLPSHAAMLAGVSLSELYKVFDTHDMSIWKDYIKKIPTITSGFKQAGFTARAITGGGYLSRYFGWGADWDEWQTPEEGFPDWSGEEYIPKEKELLFLHTYYIHNWFQEDETIKRWFKKNMRVYDRSLPYDLTLMKRAKTIYLERIQTFADRLGWLKNVPDDTLVVLTSDHGEMFYEDKISFHHGDLAMKNPILFHVPLLMRVKERKKVHIDACYFDVSFSSMVKEISGIQQKTGIRSPFVGVLDRFPMVKRLFLSQ